MTALIELSLADSHIEKLKSFYSDREVLVTGGASFIGSHLADSLLALGAQVSIVDDLSSGRQEFIPDRANFTLGDLRSAGVAERALRGTETVFHLAAVHGGRGFIESKQREMLANFTIDNQVFNAALQSGAANVVHASSACVYPVGLQESEKEVNFLHEEMAGFATPEMSFPDGTYGWMKLMGEHQLDTYCQGTGLSGRSARIFTAFGERENESHAAVALIAKAFHEMVPFPIWGNGEQTRNFTYVADTVAGLLLLGTDIDGIDYDVFNVGSNNHIRVIEFAEKVFEKVGWEPRNIDFQLDRPTGVKSRVSDNSKIKKKFDWEPNVTMEVGISRTVDWYRAWPHRAVTANELELRL